MMLFERHDQTCSCSYCGNSYDRGLRFGLNIPKDWTAWNSWWTVKVWPKIYLRFTRPRMAK